MTVGEFSFQRIEQPTIVKPVGLENVKVNFLVAGTCIAGSVGSTDWHNRRAWDDGRNDLSIIIDLNFLVDQQRGFFRFDDIEKRCIWVAVGVRVLLKAV